MMVSGRVVEEEGGKKLKCDGVEARPAHSPNHHHRLKARKKSCLSVWPLLCGEEYFVDHDNDGELMMEAIPATALGTDNRQATQNVLFYQQAAKKEGPPAEE